MSEVSASPLEVCPLNGNPRLLRISEVELIPSHASAFVQSALHRGEERQKPRQIAEALEQCAATEMNLDDDEIGSANFGQDLLDAAHGAPIGVAEALADEVLDTGFAECGVAHRVVALMTTGSAGRSSAAATARAP